MTAKQIKHLIFAFLMFALTGLFWRQLVLFFTDENVKLNELIYAGISLMVFLTFALLFLVLVDSRNVAYASFLVSSGVFFLLFKFNYIYLISIIVFLLSLIIAHERIKSEKEDRLKISLKKLWARGLPFMVIGLCLIISAVYYFNPLLKIGQDEIKIPPQAAKWLIKPLGGLFGKALPFDPEMTIDEILVGTMLSGGQIQPQSFSPELLEKINMENISGADINELLKDPEIGALLREEIGKQSERTDPKLLAQQRNEFAKSLGITLKGDETFDVILVELINSKLGSFIGPYAKSISIGIAVTLFFILRLAFIFLGLVAMILAQIIFLILEVAKVVWVEKAIKEGEAIKI